MQFIILLSVVSLSGGYNIRVSKKEIKEIVNNISLLTLARTSDKNLVKGGIGDEREGLYLPYESENI